MSHCIAKVDFYTRVEQVDSIFFYNHKVNPKWSVVVSVEEHLKVVDEALYTRFYLLPRHMIADEVLQFCLCSRYVP